MNINREQLQDYTELAKERSECGITHYVVLENRKMQITDEPSDNSRVLKVCADGVEIEN